MSVVICRVQCGVRDEIGGTCYHEALHEENKFCGLKFGIRCQAKCRCDPATSEEIILARLQGREVKTLESVGESR